MLCHDSEPFPRKFSKRFLCAGRRNTAQSVQEHSIMRCSAKDLQIHEHNDYHQPDEIPRSNGAVGSGDVTHISNGGTRERGQPCGANVNARGGRHARRPDTEQTASPVNPLAALGEATTASDPARPRWWEPDPQPSPLVVGAQPKPECQALRTTATCSRGS